MKHPKTFRCRGVRVRRTDSYGMSLGYRVGRLEVIGHQFRIGYHWFAVCRCECGNVVVVRHTDLRKYTRSCGCVRVEQARLNGRIAMTHGMTNTSLYGTWRSMMKRCYKLNHQAYSNYGERGICVCDEWHSFDVFSEWAIANGWKSGLTIERSNVDGNYIPQNCVFIPKRRQAVNKRTNVRVTVGDVTKCAAEWSRDDMCSVSSSTIIQRLRRGWSNADAVLQASK
jgi:hypothetical protein